MIHRVTLPSIKAAIIPVREKIREVVSQVRDGDFVCFSYSTSEGHSSYRDLIEEYGLIFHELKAGEIVFTRPARIERWDYAFPVAGITDIPKEWNCLDVGSGRKSWPRANVIVDVVEEFGAHAREGQRFVRGTITERLPFNNKEFDFVTCFHVLEHVSDPVAAAKELSRIGKRGLVEVPHPVKEGMLLFHETDHRWFVMPGKDRLIFHRIPVEWWKKMQDPEAQAAAARNFVSGSATMGDTAILRKYFTRIEAWTNIIHPWEGELKVEIIE